MKPSSVALKIFVLVSLLVGSSLVGAWALAQEPTFAVQTNHSTPVVTFSFSGDGRYMLTGSFSGEFKLWETSTRRELRTFGQRLSSVVAFVGSSAISPDGKTAALATMSKVSFWDISTGREIQNVASGAEGNTIFWDAKGRFVAGDNKQLTIYDLAGNRVVTRLAPVGGSFAVSPDGERVAVIRRRIEVREMATNRLQAEINFSPFPWFSAVAFSPDGRSVLSGDAVGAIKLHDAATGRTTKVLAPGLSPEEQKERIKLLGPGSEFDNKINAFAFNARADLMASLAADGEIVVWRWPTGEKLFVVEKIGALEALPFISLADPGSAIRFTPDGEYLAVCRGSRAVEFFSLDSKEGSHAEPKQPQAAPLDTSLNNLVKYVGPGKFYMLPGGPTVHFSAGGRWLSVLGLDPYLVSLASGEVTRGRGSEGEILAKLSPVETTGVTLSTDNTLRLRDFDTESSFTLGVVPPESLLSDISSDGSRLLSASFSAGAVKLWDLQERRERHAWRLPDDDTPILGNIFSPTLLSPDAKLFVSLSADGVVKLRDATSGKVLNSIKDYAGPKTGLMFGAFSPDGKTLALSAPGKLKLWDAARGRELRSLHTTKNTMELLVALTYSPDGQLLYAMDSLFRVWRWEVGSGREDPPLDIFAEEYGARTPAFGLPFGEGLPLGISLSADGQVLATNIRRGDVTEVILIELARRRRLANVYVRANGDWLVKLPDGRFDANRLDSAGLLFGVFPDEPDKAFSLDVFLKDYFEPRLLPRLLSGEQLRPVRDISAVNRVQPIVSPPQVTWRGGDSVEVTVEVRSAVGKAQKDGRGLPLESGVFDVRLLRDGQLVGYSTPDEKVVATPLRLDGMEELAAWREANSVRLVGGRDRLTFRVKLPRGSGGRKVEFSAYAFNSDRVKSETARTVSEVRRAPATREEPRRAYVITVGVNKYQNPAWNLRFAANDSRLARRLFSERLRALGEFSEVVEVALVSDDEEAGGRLVARRDATKANIRTVFDLLAGRRVAPERAAALGAVAANIRRANPDDLILVSFSSHGYVDAEGVFYLLPSDIGEGTSREVTPTVLKNSISSDELSLWLRGVDAGEMVLVVDACHAAAAVEGKGFKPAPMGSRGLGQLAYDKGIRILAATQAADFAVESGGTIQQGLLSYALLREGLEQNAADFKPRDKVVKLKEWLEYGVRRVPRLYEELAAGKIRSAGSGARDVFVEHGNNHRLFLQQPALFDFHRKPTETTLARIH